MTEARVQDPHRVIRPLRHAGHMNVEGADEHLAHVCDRLAGAFQSLRDGNERLAVIRHRRAAGSRPGELGGHIAVGKQNAADPRDSTAELHEAIYEVVLRPQGRIVQLVHGALELRGGSEEVVNMPIQNRCHELDRGQTPDFPLILDQGAMRIEERNRSRVSSNYPALASEDPHGLRISVEILG